MKLTSGSFTAKMLPDAEQVDAYYVPAPGYGDGWSAVLTPGASPAITRRTPVAKRTAKKRR